MSKSAKKTAAEGLDHFIPSDPAFKFRNYPFYWVARLSNRYTLEMEKQLKPFGMNISSWRIGLILREYGVISMSEVATHAVLRLPTVNKLVYRMQEQGLVSVHRSETDARVTMVGITDQGHEVVSELIKKTSKTVERALDGLSSDEVNVLNTVLGKVFANLA
ncbi:MAG: MarR family transcriptional regulator [Pseudomonadota bacterium]